MPMKEEKARRKPAYEDGRQVFIRDIPIGLKDLFKAYCYKRGGTLKGEIVRFMRECVKADKEKLKPKKAR